MILNRGPLVVVDKKTKVFDYSGCINPVGLVPDEILYYNIDKILFQGFVDEDEQRFIEMYENWKEHNGSKIEKSIVDNPI